MLRLVVPVLALVNGVAAFRASTAVARSARMTRSMSMMAEPPAVNYAVGFMFPGQGAQAVGMAGPLCAELPAAKALFDKASVILGYDLLAKCVDGPKDELDR